MSNSRAVEGLATGKLVKSLFPTKVATTVKYVDKKGILRYKGSKQLKSTQFLGEIGT